MQFPGLAIIVVTTRTIYSILMQHHLVDFLGNREPGMCVESCSCLPCCPWVYKHVQRSEKVIFVWKYREPGKQDNVNRINVNMLKPKSLNGRRLLRNRQCVLKLNKHNNNPAQTKPNFKGIVAFNFLPASVG